MFECEREVEIPAGVERNFREDIGREFGWGVSRSRGKERSVISNYTSGGEGVSKRERERDELISVNQTFRARRSTTREGELT